MWDIDESDRSKKLTEELEIAWNQALSPILNKQRASKVKVTMVIDTVLFLTNYAF